MAFVRPTITELVTRIEADLVSRLTLTGAVLRRSIVAIFARVFAGAVHLLYGAIEFLSRQLFADASEAEFLVRQAALFGVDRHAPTFTTATATAIGVNGSVIPAGTVLVLNDAEFVTGAGVTIAGGTGTLALTAVLAGSASALSVGSVLSFASPIAGVNATAAVTAVVDGVDEESIEDLRERLLLRLREPAHGGDESDYIAWARTVAGVDRVWVRPRALGPGTVLVYFMNSGGVPSAPEIAAVQDVFDTEAPVHAEVTAAAPTPVDYDITVTVVVAPGTLTAVTARLVALMDDFVQRNAAPGVTLYKSALTTALGAASDVGLIDFSVASPAGNVSFAAHEIPSGGERFVIT